MLISVVVLLLNRVGVTDDDYETTDRDDTLYSTNTYVASVGVSVCMSICCVNVYVNVVKFKLCRNKNNR